MPSEILYKRLFEIHVFHEYYLMQADGKAFFELAQEEQKKVLTKKIENLQYDIRKDLVIEPTADCRTKMKASRIKFVETSMGGFTGIEVEKEQQDNGKIIFKPKVKLAKDLKLVFNVRIKNPFFFNITQLPLEAPFPAVLYFSNSLDLHGPERIAGTNSINFSKPIRPFDSATFYRMGEMAFFDSDLKQALEDNPANNPDKWGNQQGGGYINRQDRILIPRTLAYRFPNYLDLSKSEFLLNDNEENEVLDFEKKIDQNGFVVLKFPAQNPLTEEELKGKFSLNVKARGENRYKNRHSVLFNDDLYKPDILGVIELDINSSENPQSILTNNQLKEVNPIFNLRFDNRITWWRYNKQDGFTKEELCQTRKYLRQLNQINDTDDKEVFKLVSKIPVGLTKVLFNFSGNQGANSPDPSMEEMCVQNNMEPVDPLRIPNPNISPIKREKTKLYSDIEITNTNRLVIT